MTASIETFYDLLGLSQDTEPSKAEVEVDEEKKTISKSSRLSSVMRTSMYTRKVH